MKPKQRALQITLIYLLVMLLWVILGDALLSILALTAGETWFWHYFKALVFGLLSAGLLYVLVLKALQQQASLNQHAQASEAKHQSLFDSVFQQAAVGIARTDAEGRWLDVNPRLCELLGCTETDLRSRCWQSFTHPEDLSADVALTERLLAGEIHEFDLEKRYIRPSGEVFWGHLIVSAARGQLKPDYYIIILIDITERRRVEEELRHQQQMLSNTERLAQIGSWEWEVASDRVTWSAELFRIFQRDPVQGAPTYADHEHIYSPEDHQRITQAVEQALAQGQSFELELQVRRPSGEIRHAIARGEPQRDAQGAVNVLVGSFQDVTALRRSERKLERLAYYDTLTQLPNRVLLQQRVGQALRKQQHFALLLLDLDRFKQVNDSLGHHVGDRLLVQVAEALNMRMGKTDTLARFGGDEFVVLMECYQHPEWVARLAVQLLTIFDQPFLLNGQEFYLTASIGISMYPEDGETVDALLRNADVAMHQSKASTRNGYRFFESAMLERVAGDLRLENALWGALARGELQLHYQPQVSLDDGSLLGVEVLLRWEQPALGPISPGVFIPVAEDIGLMPQLGKWVLEQACQQLLAWDSQGLRIPRLAVNLSIRQLETSDFLDGVLTLLANSGVNPQRLQLEVTETLLMRGTGEAMTSLRTLRERGVSIAIDDFGTGYCSLSYLQRLPVDELKIDKSFVENLPGQPGDALITRAVIGLGRSLGLRVLAEGVETAEQAAFLRQEDCHAAQGYLYGRPLPPQQLFEHYSNSSIA